MSATHPRIAREGQTIQVMIEMYCHDQHHSEAGLCGECATLQSYALERLTRCPFQAGKTTCARCPVHCYKPEMRQQVKLVMRYAGPHMLTRHPILAIWHLKDGLRKQPIRPTRSKPHQPD